MKYLNRMIEAKIKEWFKHYPVLLVTGARQVGKSTLVDNLFKDSVTKIVFDPVQDVSNAREDPDFFLQNIKLPAFLDEIQYAPELLPSIKRHIDKAPSPGQFILSGSQNLSVLKDISESLAGRVGVIDLYPMSQRELRSNTLPVSFLYDWVNTGTQMPYQEVSPAVSLYEAIWRGGYPKLIEFPNSLIPGFFQSYLRTYIERDVRKTANINNLQEFGRFSGLLSAYTAQQINPNEIGRELGIDRKTISHWKQIAQATYQWYSIPAFTRNPVKKTSGKQKGYFCDTGFACYLQRLSSPQSLSNHPMLRRFFESFVFMEILKSIQSWPLAPALYHYRTYAGAEVDLILEYNGKLFPVEFKCTSQPKRSHTKGFNSFAKNYPSEQIQKGLVICSVESPAWLSDEVLAVPWWLI